MKIFKRIPIQYMFFWGYKKKTDQIEENSNTTLMNQERTMKNNWIKKNIYSRKNKILIIISTTNPVPRTMIYNIKIDLLRSSLLTKF